MIVQADCGGTDPKLTCSCCKICCATIEHECCTVKPLPWADIGACFPTLPLELQGKDNPFDCSPEVSTIDHHQFNVLVINSSRQMI
eukprot:3437925-Ditylum_brightwellii.AAC.1